MKVIIISRHPAAARFCQEWVKTHFLGDVACSVIEQATGEEQADAYVGILPVPLIQQFQQRGEVYLLTLPSVAFSQRGQELTAEEMEAAGAAVTQVIVTLKPPAMGVALPPICYDTDRDFSPTLNIGRASEYVRSLGFTAVERWEKGEEGEFYFPRQWEVEQAVRVVPSNGDRLYAVKRVS